MGRRSAFDESGSGWKDSKTPFFKADITLAIPNVVSIVIKMFFFSLFIFHNLIYYIVAIYDIRLYTRVYTKLRNMSILV